MTRYKKKIKKITYYSHYLTLFVTSSTIILINPWIFIIVSNVEENSVRILSYFLSTNRLQFYILEKIMIIIRRRYKIERFEIFVKGRDIIYSI